MSELKPRIHDEDTGIDYILAGDYYIPAIELPEDDYRPIGKWGQMYRAYLEETNSRSRLASAQPPDFDG